MAKPDAPKRWHVFAVQSLPVRYDEPYQVQTVVEPGPDFRGIPGLAQAVDIRDRTGADLVCILEPDGRVSQLGPRCDRAPTMLRGALVRQREGAFVRLTAPSA